MNDPPCAAERFRWEFAGLRWTYESRLPRFHRFGVGDGSRGVGMASNPVSAYLALRRWRRVPARPQ